MSPSLPTRFQLVPLIIPHPLNRAILAVRVVWSFSFVKCMAPTCVVFFLSQFFFFFFYRQTLENSNWGEEPKRQLMYGARDGARHFLLASGDEG